MTVSTRQPPKRSLAERFFEKTESEPRTGCRLWQGATAAGAGCMIDAEGKQRRAAHIAVELATGAAVPKGSVVRPTCGVPLCVAVEHLAVHSPHGRGASRKVKSAAERLAAKALPRPDGCLIWTGSTDLHGYGQISVNGRMKKAHRLAWSLAQGRLAPAGMHICHTCDEPLCIRPAHLKLGTAEDNRRDRRERGRSARSKNSHPQMNAADRAHMLATKEAGYTLANIAGGWAMSMSGVQQALALAVREREALAALSTA